MTMPDHNIGKRDRHMLEDPIYNLWILLSQTRTAIFKAREKEFSQYGITAVEAGALFAIKGIGGQATPAEISRWLFREHHTITALLNRMEGKGLIEKTNVYSIGRKKIWSVSLTEKGEHAYLQSTKREAINKALSSLSESEYEQLGSTLTKIRGQALTQLVSERTIPFP